MTDVAEPTGEAPGASSHPAPARSGSPSWIARLMTLDADGDRFVAVRPAAHHDRLFGGLIAAQALKAAMATVEAAMCPQSLHACFVRAGRPDADVVYEVDRIRDGRSFGTRHVTATQDGKVILEMLATFHAAEPGADSHPPASPGPSLDECTETLTGNPISTQFAIRVPETGYDGPTGHVHWLRSIEPVEDDPGLRACALTYLSDMGLLGASRPPGLERRPGVAGAASLDHSIWFHRGYDPNEWHRYSATRLNSSNSCGLALGALHDADGGLIATTAQEGLWRV